MTSLITCIRRAGKALSKEDADAIREITAEGIPAVEAVDEWLSELAIQREQLLDEIDAAGGTDEPLGTLDGPLTMEEIDFDPELTGDAKAQEMKFAQEMVSRDWAGIVKEYEALDGTNGPEDVEGGKVNSVDAWRELSVDYRNDRSTSAAAHEVASAMSKKYYAQKLATPPYAGAFSEYFLWTSGGTGAGKTSGLGKSQYSNEATLIFDGNLAKVPSAIKKIDQALAAGRLVDINHVTRNPVEALVNGAVFRAMRQWMAHGSGRIVPLRAHVFTHVGSAEAMRELYEHYKNDQRVHFEITDNNHGKGGARLGTMDDVLTLDYNELMQQSRAALQDIYENGHPNLDYPLASELYYGFIEEPIPAGTGRFHSNYADSTAAPDVQRAAQAQSPEVHPRAEPQGAGGPREQLGVRRAELQLGLAPAIRALVGTVRTNVVQSTDEIPGEAVPADVEGMWRSPDGRDVWLVADNLPTVERAKKVFAHEAFGHLAMEQQPEFQDVLASVKNLLALNNKAFTDAADKISITQGNLNEDNQAKEILAYMAENGIENGTIGRALAAVRGMLRRMGLLDGANYSEAEIKALLVRAARDLVSGAEAKQKALAAMPVQEQVLKDPDAVADAIYNAINEVYANGTLMDYTVSGLASGEGVAAATHRATMSPIVGPDVISPEALYSVAYHGTGAMFNKFDINYTGAANGTVGGWGIYFSSQRAVAEWYKGDNGNLMEAEIPDEDDLLQYDNLMGEQPDILSKIPEEIQDGIMAAYPNLSTAIADMRGGQFYGYLGSYLQAKQFEEQAGGVTKAMAKALPGMMGLVSTYANRDKLASLYLKEHGIPGHMLSGRTDGGRNHVIYDDAAVKINKVNDAPIAALANDVDSLFSRAGVRSEGMEYQAEPGEPFLVYRFGKGSESLENRNAGNASSVANRLAVFDDYESPQSLNADADTVSVYEVTADKFGDYIGFNRGLPAGRYGEPAPEPGAFVGRSPSISKAVVQYSFGTDGYTSKKVAELPLEGLRKKLNAKYGYKSFDMSGSAVGARLINDQAALAMPRQIRKQPQMTEQQALFSKAPPVESPAFNAWFGDSKVVNEDGSPQVVYHGTKAEDFDAFRAKYSDGLIFFTKDAAFAGKWLEGTGGLRTPPADTAPHIKLAKETERRLTTEIMGDHSGYDYNNQADMDRWEANRALIRSRMKEETGFETASRLEDVSGIRVIPTYLSVQKPFDPRQDWAEIEDFLLTLGHGMDQIVKNGNHKTGNWVVYEKEEVINELKRLGYDGIYITENIGGEHDTIGVFSPEQVKSATGNRGTFDATDPNILYSRKIHSDPEIERIRDKVLAPALEDFTVKDRVRDVVNRVRGIEWLGIKQGIVDSAASVEELEKGIFGKVQDASISAYKGILSTRNLGSVMAAIMHRGIPIYQNGVFTARTGRQGLIQIFEKITHHEDGNLLPLWELYAAAMRSQRLITEKNQDGSSKEKVFTQDEISKALTLGIEYPEFKTAFLEWQKFNSQLLDLAIKTGVINGAEAKIWRQNDYVPFYRAMEEIEYQGGQGPQTGREGVANVRSGIKRLSGSESKIGNVFENMVMNTAYLIDASYRNTAMQRVVGMTDMIAMHKVPMAFEAIRFSDADLARALMKAGLIVGNGTTEADVFNDGIRQIGAMTQEQKEHWSTLFRRVAPRGPNIVSVLIEGKPVYYEVDDPLLMRSIAAMGAQQAGGIMNTFRFAKRVLTKSVTIDPAFMMANFLRDTLSTAVVVKGSGAKQILGAMKGLKDAFNEDEDIMAMMMAGAGGGGFYDHNPADVRKMLAKKMPAGKVNAFANSIITPRGAYRAWQKIGNASEQANRVALYKRIIAEGGTPAEAAYQARDVLNFTMSGDYGAMKFLVQTVPFLNARIQGLYRLYRGGKENPVGFAMKGLTITAATMALLLRNLEDDRYKELPEWDKDTYWHFFIGDEHLRLPKPFEVGALFATVPERAFMLGTGDDNLDITVERGWRMVMDTFAFNPVPQALKPIVEQYSNRNMFTGNPIIGMAHEGMKPESQYDPWTSETMRELAKVLPGWGGSPKRLESFMRGYFGAVGMYALGASDAVTRRAFGHPDRPTKDIRNYPVLTRFWRDPNPRTSKYSSQLYDMLGEADAVYKTMNAYRDQRRIGEAAAMLKDNRGKLAARAFLHDVSSDVRKINSQMRIIQYSDMSADKKKAAIDKLNAAKIKTMARVAKVSDMF